MIRSIYLVLLFSSLLGCSTIRGWMGTDRPAGPPKPRYNEEAAAKFAEGIRLLDSEKYSSAKAVFQSILVARPTSKFEMVVYFNLGSAYEGLGKCSKSAKIFRKIIRYSVNKFPRVEALSLLRLSYAYECLGKSTKAAATLVDVLKRQAFLPPQVGEAEVPARLAGVYAQLGNQKQALVFFQRAEKGLISLNKKRQNALAKRELMAKTLFLMGKLKIASLDRVGALKFLESVKYLQKYLLKSVEMDSEKWSSLAANHLKAAYQNVWLHLKNMPKGQTVKEKRQSIRNRVRVAEMAYLGLQGLKESRFPGDMDQPRVTSLFNHLDQEETKFQIFMAENIVGNSLTPESQRLQGLKVDGRGENRESVHERRKTFRKKNKKKNSLTKDPNL